MQEDDSAKHGYCSRAVRPVGTDRDISMSSSKVNRSSLREVLLRREAVDDEPSCSMSGCDLDFRNERIGFPLFLSPNPVGEVSLASLVPRCRGEKGGRYTEFSLGVYLLTSGSGCFVLSLA